MATFTDSVTLWGYKQGQTNHKDHGGLLGYKEGHDELRWPRDLWGHKLGQTDHKAHRDLWDHKVGHGDLWWLHDLLRSQTS